MPSAARVARGRRWPRRPTSSRLERRAAAGRPASRRRPRPARRRRARPSTTRTAATIAIEITRYAREPSLRNVDRRRPSPRRLGTRRPVTSSPARRSVRRLPDHESADRDDARAIGRDASSTARRARGGWAGRRPPARRCTTFPHTVPRFWIWRPPIVRAAARSPSKRAAGRVSARSVQVVERRDPPARRRRVDARRPGRPVTSRTAVDRAGDA